MKYKLKSWDYDGSPINNPDGTTTYPIIITPEIEGDIYGFVSPIPSMNQTKIIVPAKIEADQIKVFLQAEAEAFCSTQYPSK